MPEFKSFLIAALGGVLLVACSSSNQAASTVCSSDNDCQSGLSCTAFATYTDAGCTSGPKACSTTCTKDGDCASLGAGFMCFAGCGDTMFCGATK